MVNCVFVLCGYIINNRSNFIFGCSLICLFCISLVK